MLHPGSLHPSMFRRVAFSTLIALLVATESESTAQADPSPLGKITQHDPVTGAPVINAFTLTQETAWAPRIERETIEKEKAAGHTVNSDPTAQARIERILKGLCEVSHLPKVPWRFAYSSSPVWNAFAYPGGFILINKGFADDVNDDEMAAVLGHEVAHVTCRHMTERMTHESITNLASEAAQTALYKASYSTECEAEADRVGILYAALAGYDPTAAHRVWSRRHAVVGSNPHNYAYTHPLNKDRAEATGRWGETATRYFAGSRVMNPKFGEILATNELAPRVADTGSETVDFLSAALQEHLKYRQAKAEAERREQAEAVARERKAAAMKFIKITRVFVGKSAAGKPGVFADIQNGSNTLMRKVSVQFLYKTVQGTWAPYQGRVALADLRAGETRNWGIEFQAAAHGGWQFSASIVDVDF